MANELNRIRHELEKAFIAFMNDPETNMIKLAEWMEIYAARSRDAGQHRDNNRCAPVADSAPPAAGPNRKSLI